MPERVNYWGIPHEWGAPEIYVYTIMFLAAFINIAAPFAIIEGVEWVAYIKLAAFILFQAMALLLLWGIFDAAYTGMATCELDMPSTDAHTTRILTVGDSVRQ